MGRRKGAELQTPEEVKAKKREWYLKNREISLLRARGQKDNGLKWQRDNRDKVNARVKTWRQTLEGKEKSEHDSLMRRFKKHGLTLDQYHAKIESQDMLCAICREAPTDNYGGLHDGFHIDHHHGSGRVRGLLCKHCNIGIGMLKDSPEICIAAANYLSSR